MAEPDASRILDQRPASLPQTTAGSSSPSPLPRVTISYCIQCKWMLRAAWLAQELLSTFSTSLGEVALRPATGGIFVVEIDFTDPTPTDERPNPNPTVQRRLLWDRKIDGGFPEAKELKRRVRDVIEPGRNLGHVDRDYPRPQQSEKERSERAPDPTQTDPILEAEHEQKQPVGPRWPQLNNSASSQPASQGQQARADPQSETSANTDTQTRSQKTPRDLGPYPREKVTDSDGPVYNPRMPGGGIMPVVPPVAAKAQRECEDCQ
ncbi:hypothetical protein F5Y10DRAFT_193212 [Nemania abortiva]|nr:hypothetical protein F5Y10DRAFT_193212 [Nemania abortiva]